MQLRPLVLLCAASAIFAEDSDPLNDLRLGITIQQAPSIQERVTAPSGEAASYTWEDAQAWNMRYELMYLQGMSRRGRGLGGLLWGAGLFYGSSDTTPDSYSTSGGIDSENSRSDIELTYREVGLSLGFGYASAPIGTEMGAFNWELMPVVGGGWAFAETVTPGFTSTMKSDSNYFWEGGVRATVALADDGWLAALHIGYLYGKAEFDIGMGNAGDSRLVAIRNGLEAGLHLGFRF